MAFRFLEGTTGLVTGTLTGPDGLGVDGSTVSAAALTILDAETQDLSGSPVEGIINARSETVADANAGSRAELET